jgi:uncharacterized membrane-anchored protein YjiN (DUF445 family)
MLHHLRSSLCTAMTSSLDSELAAPPNPSASPDSDAARRANLKTMKRRATAMLVAAAVIFVAVRISGNHDGIFGYIEAISEAAMVGGLADWFAVTALFRHPLGIPIPHTAIIPNRKDEIGRSLGVFIRENFLDRTVLSDRLAESDLAMKAGDWMTEPQVASQISTQVVSLLSGVSEVLNDDDAQASLERILGDRIRDYPVAPLAGRVLNGAIEGGHHQTVFDSSIVAIAKLVAENRELLRQRLSQESPWWVPESVDDRVFHRIYDAIHRFIADVASDPHHEFRGQFHDRAVTWATDLQNSPQLISRGEELKEELLDHPEFKALTAQIWDGVKASLTDAANNPDSHLNQRIEAAVHNFGVRLQNEEHLRNRVNRWIASAVGQVAERSGEELTDFIASTVARWDTEETSERIELQVGRDLQFIRINGTVVGGLAGLVIHAVGDILGG